MFLLFLAFFPFPFLGSGDGFASGSIFCFQFSVLAQWVWWLIFCSVWIFRVWFLISPPSFFPVLGWPSLLWVLVWDVRLDVFVVFLPLCFLSLVLFPPSFPFFGSFLDITFC